MRGVLLAGGKGSRLLPATKVINKHMVPILNRPMITYPLETLRVLGCADILVVSGGNHVGGIAEFLGDGSDFGVRLTYKVQKEAGGIAQALGLAKNFAAGEDVLVALGDNVFDNARLAARTTLPFDPQQACIFIAQVPDPSRFGVVAFEGERIVAIEEKPRAPKSSFAVTGLYHYPSEMFDVIPTLAPSARGEMEITDVNNHFLRAGALSYVTVDGFWSDAGTPESLYEVTRWAHGESAKNPLPNMSAPDSQPSA